MMPRDLVAQLFDNACSIYHMIGFMLVASGRYAKLGMQNLRTIVHTPTQV